MHLLNNKRLIVVSLAVLVGVGAVSFFAFTLLVDDPFTEQDVPKQQGIQWAQGRLSGSDEVALFVNGYPVSVAEVMESKAVSEFSTKTWRSAYDRRISANHPSLNEKGLNHAASKAAFYDGESPVLEDLVIPMKPQIDIWEKHGTDAMAVGHLISVYAYLTTAMEAGYALTDAEVAAEVARRREVHEETRDEKTTQIDLDQETGESKTVIYETVRNHSVDSYIETVGEDKYWNEILPAQVFREMTTYKWREAAYGDVKQISEMYEINLRLNREAEANVKVEFTDKLRMNVTLNQAFAFIRDSRNYDSQLARDAAKKPSR
ncbi:MAG: hypothetical protein OXD46_04680 [Chloroflexi bacterium]|nr:hypothetical protein [Chloroflexota bacterium]